MKENKIKAKVKPEEKKEESKDEKSEEKSSEEKKEGDEAKKEVEETPKEEQGQFFSPYRPVLPRTDFDPNFTRTRIPPSFWIYPHHDSTLILSSKSPSYFTFDLNLISPQL